MYEVGEAKSVMAEGSSNNPAHLSGMLCSGCPGGWSSERGASYDGLGEGSVTRGCWRRHASATSQARYNNLAAACSLQHKEHVTAHLEISIALQAPMPCHATKSQLLLQPHAAVHRQTPVRCQHA